MTILTKILILIVGILAALVVLIACAAAIILAPLAYKERILVKHGYQWDGSGYFVKGDNSLSVGLVYNMTASRLDDYLSRRDEKDAAAQQKASEASHDR